MSDRAAVALAVATWLGALAAWSFPWAAAAVLVAVALWRRRPWLLVAGAALLASGLAASAWDGLAPPRTAPVDGWAVVVRDPDRAFGAVRVELRLGRRHVDAWARGAPGSALAARMAGEQVFVAGRLSPLSARARTLLAPRHVAAHLDVEGVGDHRPGSPAARLANGLRRELDRSAGGLDVEARSLLLGVAVGERRGRPPDLETAFRAAGLSHLLAVSGQNVAFVLALAAPVLRRLPLRGRWVATLAILVWFGLLTRWEPSVVRASAMAALAATSALMGRPATAVRLLALAVTAALLADPLLVHSIGFQLSVGATAGIALLGARFADWLPGPAAVRSVLAVTAAAQLGVAPVAIPVFGGLPLASLPANLLAVPAAAPLASWGLTGGVLAGRIPVPLDGLFRLPTVVLAGWLAGVARWAASLPLGQVRTGHLLVGLTVAAFVVSARWSWRWMHAGST